MISLRKNFKKIFIIIGARPQFIKHAPVEMALKEDFELISLHTGQHYDHNMSKVFFDQLGINSPDYRLAISGGNHGFQSGKMMMEIEPILEKEKPDAVLVYGDTNSTLAGALVGAKLNIPIIHIEAGLRSFNREMPEEINRILTDHVSTVLIAPTNEAIKNLNNEGISENIFRTGDVMCDMVKIAVRITKKESNQAKKFYYATIHRPYNTEDDKRIKRLLNIFNDLDKPIKFPLHPRTRKKMEIIGLKNEDFPNIEFIPPVGYFVNISNLIKCEALITDSGGMQKEAYILKKRCVTIRPETEWIETLDGGWNQLIFNNLETLNDALHKPMGTYKEEVYGDGGAAQEINEILKSFFY